METTELPIKQGLVLDILDTNAPALSSTNDMPIETKPDSSPPEKEVEKAAPPDEGEAELIDESATSATEDEKPGVPGEEKRKASRGVQKKLDELTRREIEAVQRAEASERRLDEMLKRIPAEPAKTEVVDELVRPSRMDFEDEAAYFDALGEYSEQKATLMAKREIKATIERQNTEAQEKAVAEGQRIARESYLGRVKKTQEKYADFKEVAESPDVVVSIPMAHAIVHHESGPDIQYYLGQNPAEALRISALDVPSQLVELGVIVATKLKAEEKPKPISAAPKPLSQTKASESIAVKDPSLMNMDEYSAWRKKEARH